MIFIIYQDFKNTINVSEVLNYVLEWRDFFAFHRNLGVWSPCSEAWDLKQCPGPLQNGQCFL